MKEIYKVILTSALVSATFNYCLRESPQITPVSELENLVKEPTVRVSYQAKKPTGIYPYSI